jgi:hypothetical protein
MRAIPNLFVAICMLMLGLGGCAAAPARPTEAYPVWWSPDLGVESLDQIDALLAKTIPKDQQYFAMKFDWKRVYKDTLVDEDRPELGFEFYMEKVNVEQYLVDNCLSFFKWFETGFNANGYDAFQLQVSLSGYCYTLRALKTARPARTSHVRDFAFGDDAMDHIPAMVGAGWECKDINEMLEANRRGVSWSEHRYDAVGDDVPDSKVRADNETSFTVEVLFPESKDEVHIEIHITIFGRGDFNGDGIDDLLMGRDWKDMILGSHTSARYLVTRWKRDDALRVVEVVGPGPWKGLKCVPRTQDLAPE